MTTQNDYSQFKGDLKATVISVGVTRAFNDGTPVCNARVAVYEGKEKSGAYKESRFVNLVGIGEFASYVSSLQPKQKVRAQGDFRLKVWVNRENVKVREDELYVTDIGVLAFERQ